MDRNRLADMSDAWHRVALRKESVDRNRLIRLLRVLLIWSLSARRAWIEITLCLLFRPVVGSLSARRAWIEIIKFVNIRVLDGVALRKESVDRNRLM